MVPFALIVLVMFGFALDADAVLSRVAPGLIWLATMFSLLAVVQRSFAVETADGALDALQVAGVNPAGIFLGKTAALVVQLLVLQVLAVVVAVVLYQPPSGATGEHLRIDLPGLGLLAVTLLPLPAGWHSSVRSMGFWPPGSPVARPSSRSCSCRWWPPSSSVRRGRR